MENVARIQVSPFQAAAQLKTRERKSKSAILPKVIAFLRSLFAQPDLDYGTFERLESKRTPQEMRRNGLY